ncbi:PEP-utilizing enzyme [Desulfosporosinus sp. BICA1-9]|uniref:PEP-utilizing enzyme n=1 Tax=Desulfosporosinus sp. BICA1-9 TaxID=1531958 RepID=UPI00054B8F61|nr:PEP-utilizing enzyme [Desulfosporosinus sp. BICA1-9]KJS46524.1 MAG: hypothetical protein VR66_24905 [Peptococcaceae bacterium BRH_c23]KJS83001.1 MAG: hypothetical protein JL57_23420 [Desulfosporosinus sp. BICA1-9]HBW37567.1 hypothetical protein [Desulfosporosinus sp.]
MLANEDMRLEDHQVEWVPMKMYRQEDSARLWFHDSVHNNPPSSPMGASVYHWPRGTRYAAEWFTFPYSEGFDYVLYDGRIFPGPMPITDPEVIKAKEPIFQQKLMDMLENWPQRYADIVEEWTASLDYLKGINKKTLPLDRLINVLKDAVKISKRSWELHFVCMYPAHFAYMTFEAICAKYNIEERQMRTFLQGFETKMFEIDRALWKLADVANELDLAEEFNEISTQEELNERLIKSTKGKLWLGKFTQFLEKYGRRSTAALFDCAYRTWIEDPMPAFTTIQTYILKGSFDFEKHTKKIIAERDEYIARTVADIPEEDRGEFLQALKLAQYSYPFNEDHNFYVEQWTYSELRYAIQECGRRLVHWGFIDEIDDVFFMTIDELEGVLEDILINKKIGIEEHHTRVHSMVYRRKDVWTKLHKVKVNPFIGTVPEGKIDDPVFIKIWGMTDEVIRGQAKPEIDVENRWEGFPGAPGVVEGIARVIFDYEGFSEVQPDEILIAPFTTPAWTPLFSKIRGVATDSGGMLAHAAICAREYDIPAVVGTITRGKRVTDGIVTGQKVRIDGTKGVVELLEE